MSTPKAFATQVCVFTRRHLATLVTILGGAFFISTCSYAVETSSNNRPVPSIQVNTSVYGFGYYLYDPAGWGAPGCEDATHLLIVTSEQGAKELLMVATVAHTTGKNVNVWGECLFKGFMRLKAIQIVP